MRIFHQEIVQQYNLNYPVAADGYIYMEISKGMTGLKHTGRLASDRLTNNLARKGYVPLKNTPSLWHHHISDLISSLVFKIFVIKYTCKEDADHLLKSLRKDCKITKEWAGDRYLGITLKWDYINRSLRVSIPGYVKSAVLKFQLKATKKKYAPHCWNYHIYGAKTQYANTSTSDLVDNHSTLYVQKFCGTFLY